MALKAYLKLTGATQGWIKGSVTTPADRMYLIMVTGVDHSVATGYDRATGLYSGKNQHQPIVIVKEVDKSTPLLQNALSTNENLTDWELRFYRPDSTLAGGQRQMFTLRLTNAHIASIRLEMLNIKYPDLRDIAIREKIAFTYERIRATWTDGGIEGETTWAAPP